MFWGKGVAETTCEDCRIAVGKDGIEIDASQGDLVMESLVLTVIVFVIAALYVGKKAVDKKFK
tara:strand:+ start:485 stop:673 length:189 start_codon:yes stop_codon:yes gene_type:complete